MIDTKILRETPDVLRKAIADKRNDCDLDAVLEIEAAHFTVADTLRPMSV